MQKFEVTLHINGSTYELEVPGNRTLLQVLREDLDLVDTKYGCGAGECGACTVLLDGGKAILACLTLAATMDGQTITTTAGLAQDGEMHPVQQAFVEEHAIQCGFCTPGMIMKSTSILLANPNPSEEDIRFELEGNLCRCTGYEKIVRAVEKANQTWQNRAL